MAAPQCELCLVILKRTNYRKVPDDKFSIVFELLGMTRINITCHSCYKKLSRLRNSDREIQLKIEKLRSDQSDLLDVVRQFPGVTRVNTISPDTNSMKRLQSDPHCDNKPQIKKSLYESPVDKCESALIADKSIQAGAPAGDGAVKVSVMCGDSECTSIITDSVQQNVIKRFINNGTPSSVIKHLAENEEYKQAMMDFLTKNSNVSSDVDGSVQRRQIEITTEGADYMRNLMDRMYT